MYSWRKKWIRGVFEGTSRFIEKTDVWRGRRNHGVPFSFASLPASRFTAATRGFCSSRFYMINYARFFPYQSLRYNARGSLLFHRASVCRWRNLWETKHRRRRRKVKGILAGSRLRCYARSRFKFHSNHSSYLNWNNLTSFYRCEPLLLIRLGTCFLFFLFFFALIFN